jgi:hypothetical protein
MPPRRSPRRYDRLLSQFGQVVCVFRSASVDEALSSLPPQIAQRGPGCCRRLLAFMSCSLVLPLRRQTSVDPDGVDRSTVVRRRRTLTKPGITADQTRVGTSKAATTPINSSSAETIPIAILPLSVLSLSSLCLGFRSLPRPRWVTSTSALPQLALPSPLWYNYRRTSTSPTEAVCPRDQAERRSTPPGPPRGPA